MTLKEQGTYSLKSVLPKTYLLGFSQINLEGLKEYLRDTDQEEFLELYEKAKSQNLSDGEILCSFYAKLCYKTLVLGKNANVSKIRDIDKNFNSIIDSGHGAVLEHFNMNFVVTNCSRIFCMEQIRHRVGTAYSQTSGRYVSLDEDIEMVVDPILKDVVDDLSEGLDFLMEKIRIARRKLEVSKKPFDIKKKITSALRRFAPNGQSNEIGISLNLRSARNIIQQRTSRHAEWEIRLIYNQIAQIILKNWPDLLYDCSREMIDNAYEYTNLEI